MCSPLHCTSRPGPPSRVVAVQRPCLTRCGLHPGGLGCSVAACLLARRSVTLCQSSGHTRAQGPLAFRLCCAKVAVPCLHVTGLSQLVANLQELPGVRVQYVSAVQGWRVADLRRHVTAACKMLVACLGLRECQASDSLRLTALVLCSRKRRPWRGLILCSTTSLRMSSGTRSTVRARGRCSAAPSSPSRRLTLGARRTRTVSSWFRSMGLVPFGLWRPVDIRQASNEVDQASCCGIPGSGVAN